MSTKEIFEVIDGPQGGEDDIVNLLLCPVHKAMYKWPENK